MFGLREHSKHETARCHTARRRLHFENLLEDSCDDTVIASLQHHVYLPFVPVTEGELLYKQL